MKSNDFFGHSLVEIWQNDPSPCRCQFKSAPSTYNRSSDILINIKTGNICQEKIDKEKEIISKLVEGGIFYVLEITAGVGKFKGIPWRRQDCGSGCQKR